MSDKCGVHDVLWGMMESKLDSQSEALSEIQVTLEDKMSVKIFWTMFSIFIGVLLVCFSSIYHQGSVTLDKVSHLETKIAVMEARVEFLSKSQAALKEDQTKLADRRKGL